eukprot:1148976-Lingulodinium_polyedra.AAC.1
MADHKREEIDASPDDPDLARPKAVKGDLFTASAHQMTVDGLHITARKDWPSFTGHSSQVLTAARALMLH